jgi:phage terminase large subunit
LEKPAEVQIDKESIKDPFSFIEQVLGVKNLTEEQRKIVDSVWRNRYTGVKSSPSMGKTFISACIVLAFLCPNENSKVITTAPTARQVEDLLWSEIGSLYLNAAYHLGGKLMNKDLVMGAKWFATGISTQPRKEEESAVKMRGYHAPQILVVVDEASGVHQVILEAVEDITSSEYARVLMISNPTTRSCGFYKFCKSPDTNVIEIPCFSHPNIVEGKEVIPGAISTSWVRKQVQKHCEIINSEMVNGEKENDVKVYADNSFKFDGKLYRPNPVGVWRLLAKFPETSSDTLIDYIKIESAMNRQANIGSDEVHIALDVARFGDDMSVFCINKSLNYSFKTFYHFDTAKLAGEAIKLIHEHKPSRFAVDCDGIGAGVYDILNEAKENDVFKYPQDAAHEFELIELHSAAAPLDLGQQEQFINRRAQMYWMLRSDMDMIKLEVNDELLDGLSSIKYFFNTKGKIQIEEKKEFKSRLGRSSDYEDALAYCNFLRYEESNEMKMFFLK